MTPPPPPTHHEARIAFDALNTGQLALEASAPGRVNLIGEHTDTSGGLVLPLTLARRTYVALALNGGPKGRIRANSREEGLAEADLDAPASGQWIDYICGAVRLMRQAGAQIDSLCVGLASDLPLGAGVSSSAALEIALLRALRLATGLTLSDSDLAYMAQKIENKHLGLKTGIMDQMASSLGTPGAPLLFDTHTGHTRDLPMLSDHRFLTFHSGVSRRLVDGAYNDRRAAIDLALKTLGRVRLMDVPERELAQLPAAIVPRARHVVSENARVQAAVQALIDQDAAALGHLMNQAHASMRDDFAASHARVDAQVAAATAAGALGARITGAGFGGCFVALVPEARAAHICADLLSRFPEAQQVG